MDTHPLGKTGLLVTPIGFGAFKIGRNQGAKYPTDYDLPDDQQTSALLNAVLDLGINLIDTAPAYGLSEQRIGETIGHRHDEYVLSTKVGETFTDGRSTYDFSADAITDSIQRSLERLRTDVLDVVLIHSPGDDLAVMRQTDVVPTLQDLRDKGHVRAIGLSGKTVEGAQAALDWADVISVPYHTGDTSHADVIAQARAAHVGVIVKKGLASGHLSATGAIRFVLDNKAVSSLLVGSLSIEHMRQNIAAAGQLPPTRPA